MGVIIVSTYPDVKSISKVSHHVVEKKLAACVNYTKINSVYFWQGKIHDSGEVLALFKTTSNSKQQLKKEIAKSHPYQVPEIAEIKLDDINAPYLEWLQNSTLKGKPKKRYNPSKR